MLYYCNARNIPKDATEVWFAVRSLQIYSPVKGTTYRHVSLLSPNLDLFKWARKKIDNNDWGVTEYKTYKEKFSKQLLSDPDAMNLIKYLKEIKTNKDKDIWLACYCINFERCHLKILKELIDNI